MKLNIVIKAGKVKQEIIVPIGDGAQTFKWLATVAAQRLVSDGARHGRHLPHRCDRHSLPARTNLLPKNVYTSVCPFLHPDDVIKEHVSDVDTVIVELYMPMEFDVFGAPNLSKWSFIAFRHHQWHREKRELFVQEKRLEVELFRHESSECARLQQIEVERPKIALMKKVMSKQVIDDAIIKELMDREWTVITDSGVLDNIVPDHQQQEEIKQFFIRNFVELTDMYKFYSAINSGGKTHTLEYIELCKFITETGILDEKDSNVILKVFLESHIRGIGGRDAKSKPSIHSEICQTEFFVALIKIAIYKNITVPKKEVAKIRRAGQNTPIKKATIPTVPIALETVFNDYLRPVLKRMPAGSDMRDAIASEEVLLFLHDNMDTLSKTFQQYVSRDNSNMENNNPEEFSTDLSQTENTAGAINCKQFGIFAADAGLLGGNDVIRRFSILNNGPKNPVITGNAMNMGVTQKDIRQIFAASQHDLEMTEEEENNSAYHQELMVFSEFLEGVCRIGVLKYGSSQCNDEAEIDSEKQSLSHYECIKLAVEKACSVVN